nr:MAG TPA: Protein of unknown function (DUF1640) [Caudoviricetes sp.]
MKGLSKVKAWLTKKEFIQVEQVGDTNSEYFQLTGFPITVRLGDHLGRQNTISDKYINVLPGNDCDSYVLVIDKTTKVIKYKELLKVLESFISLYSILPDHLKFRVEMKREFQQKESSLNSEINNLKASIQSLKVKMKEKMNTFSQAIKKVNNDIVVEMNNLQ